MRRATILRALGAAALAVSLTGCMKIDMQLELSSDDTVDGSMIFALSRDVAEMAESMGEDPNALFGELDQQGLPEGAEVEEYEDDDFIGQQYTFEDTDLSEFAEEEDGFGIVHEGDEFVVTGSMDMSDMDPSSLGSEDLEGLEEELGADVGNLEDLEGMMDSFDMNLSITFPGEVLEHNGELDGTTVTWTPVPGENLEISARSEDSGGGGGDGIPVWLWILIIVVVLGLFALLFFLSRNRNKGPDETAEAAEAGSVPPPPGAAADAGAVPTAPTTPIPTTATTAPEAPEAPSAVEPVDPAQPVEPAEPLEPVEPVEPNEPEPPAPPR